MLGGASPDQIRRIVQEARSAGRSPLPPADDPALRDRAMAIVEAQGVGDRLARELTPAKPIEVLPYSRLRELRQSGSREGHESLFYTRSAQMELAALACWLGMDCRDYLHDLLWAQCETTSWVMPCHAGPRQPEDLHHARGPPAVLHRPGRTRRADRAGPLRQAPLSEAHPHHVRAAARGLTRAARAVVGDGA